MAHSQEEVFHDVVIVWTAAVRQVTGRENNDRVQAFAIVTWREKVAVRSRQSLDHCEKKYKLPSTSGWRFLSLTDLRAWWPAGKAWWSACQYDAPALLWAPSSRDVHWCSLRLLRLLNRQLGQLSPRPPAHRLDRAQRAGSVYIHILVEKEQFYHKYYPRMVAGV